MTIATTTATVTYAGTSSDSALATTFPFVDEDDLIVTQRVTATGVETTMVKGTDYTVTGGGAGGATGTVQIASGVGTTKFQTGVHTWTISRDTTLTQSTDYVSNDNFPAESHEDALDKLTLIAQDLGFSVERSLKVPLSDDTALSTEIPDSVSRASLYLGFNASGVPVALAAPTGTSITTPFSLNLLDDASSSEARTTLELDGNVAGKAGSVQVFTSSDTYTKPAGLVFAIVEVVAGGGGSGGCDLTSAGETAASSGGGAGGYSRKLIAAGSIGSETVTVGTGGVAGASGQSQGGTGTSSSFGTHCSATGGDGGAGTSALSSAFSSYSATGPSGGAGADGDVNLTGGAGLPGHGNGSIGSAVGGPGGASMIGGNTEGIFTSTTSAGRTGANYGCGAAGSANGASQSATGGSAGADGIVIVWEFY